MAMTQPLWGFNSFSATGIHKAPLNKLIHIYGTGKIYELVDKADLTSATTIQEAIDGGKLLLMSGSGTSGGSTALPISIYEFSATAGQTLFSDSRVTPYSLFAVNGVILSSSEVTKVSGVSFTLKTPSAEGDVITHFASLPSKISSVIPSLSVHRELAVEGQTLFSLPSNSVESVYLNRLLLLPEVDYNLEDFQLVLSGGVSANDEIVVRYFS